MSAACYGQAANATPSNSTTRKRLVVCDVREASEKSWGAAAQIVKAAADRQGQDHHGHREPYRAVAQQRAETDDAGIAWLFPVANSLHINFYENGLERRRWHGKPSWLSMRR